MNILANHSPIPPNKALIPSQMVNTATRNPLHFSHNVANRAMSAATAAAIQPTIGMFMIAMPIERHADTPICPIILSQPPEAAAEALSSWRFIVVATIAPLMLATILIHISVAVILFLSHTKEFLTAENNGIKSAVVVKIGIKDSRYTPAPLTKFEREIYKLSIVALNLDCFSAIESITISACS